MDFAHRYPAPLSRWPGNRLTLGTALISLNVAVFLLLWLSEAFSHSWAVSTLALSHYGVAHGAYWQFFTHIFLHNSALALLFDCLGIYFAGPEVEIVCGPRHFLGIYFLGAFLGGVFPFFLIPGDIPLMGASAGVCALVLSFTTMLPELEITTFLYLIIPVRLRAKWLGWAILGGSAFLALVGAGGRAFHLACFTGALLGWAYTRWLGFGRSFWFQRLLRDRRRLRERQEKMDPNEFIRQEIDPILEKIAKEGLQSLTRAERHTLELGREKIAKKTGS